VGLEDREYLHEDRARRMDKQERMDAYYNPKEFRSGKAGHRPSRFGSQGSAGLQSLITLMIGFFAGAFTTAVITLVYPQRSQPLFDLAASFITWVWRTF